MSEWYNSSWSDVVKQLNSDITTGLKSSQVEEIRLRENHNTNRVVKDKKVAKIIVNAISQLWIFILMLNIFFLMYDKEILAALVLACVLISSIIVLFLDEYKEKKKLKQLEALNPNYARVLRDGRISRINPQDLVVGDIIYINEGEIVPSDLRLIESEDIKVKESAVTGESYEVEKFEAKLEERELSLSEMRNIIFKSSNVISGSGTGIVIAKDVDTEIGKIIRMLSEEKQDKLSFRKRFIGILNYFAKLSLIITFTDILIVIAISNLKSAVVVIPIVLLSSFPQLILLLLYLPICIMQRKMSKKGITILNLSIAEMVANISSIIIDKLGFISENNYELKKIYSNNIVSNAGKLKSIDDNMERLISICVLCNDYKINDSKSNSTKMGLIDRSLLNFAIVNSFSRPKIEKQNRKIFQIPYDSERRIATAINKVEDKYRAHVKGAVDVVLEKCTHIMKNGVEKEITDEDIENIKSADIEMSVDSLYTAATAYRNFNYEPSISENIESNLVFVGILGFHNPLREDAKNALNLCIDLGIRPIIVTEDNKLAASSLGKILNITSKGDSVISGVEIENMEQDEFRRNICKIDLFSRITPNQKVNIIQMLQDIGYKLAATGRKLVDLPALRKANVGIGIVETNNSIVQELSDISIGEGGLSKIIDIIIDSRGLINNFKTLLLYIFTCTAVESFFVMLYLINNSMNPIHPFYFLWINIVNIPICSLVICLNSNTDDPYKPQLINRKAFFKNNTKSLLGIALIGAVLSYSGYYLGLKSGIIFPEINSFIVITFFQITLLIFFIDKSVFRKRIVLSILSGNMLIQIIISLILIRINAVPIIGINILNVGKIAFIVAVQLLFVSIVKMYSHL